MKQEETERHIWFTVTKENKVKDMSYGGKITTVTVNDDIRPNIWFTLDGHKMILERNTLRGKKGYYTYVLKEIVKNNCLHRDTKNLVEVGGKDIRLRAVIGKNSEGLYLHMFDIDKQIEKLKLPKVTMQVAVDKEHLVASETNLINISPNGNTTFFKYNSVEYKIKYVHIEGMRYYLHIGNDDGHLFTHSIQVPFEVKFEYEFVLNKDKEIVDATLTSVY